MDGNGGVSNMTVSPTATHVVPPPPLRPPSPMNSFVVLVRSMLPDQSTAAAEASAAEASVR